MGEDDATTRPPVEPAPEPFPHSGLAALLAAAATDCPREILFHDDAGEVTAAEAGTRVEVAAAQLRHLGIRPGERVLVVAGAETAAVVALAATLAIGAEPALVPCGLGPVDLATHARVAGAVALIGPSLYGTLELGDTYLSTAALVDSIRVVATQGPGAVDGAADLSADALAKLGSSRSPADPPTAEAPSLATFEGPPSAPSLVLHRQAALFADALSLVERARINPTKRIVSTLPVATMAGLVVGPFAALIGAASLSLHGPFDARRFLAACDAQPGAHLVMPLATASAFEEARLAQDFTSLIFVSRFADPKSFALPRRLACDRPIVDVYAFGEDTLLARRRTDGEAHPPVRVTDKRPDGGLGAQLNRARAEHYPHRSSERG